MALGGSQSFLNQYGTIIPPPVRGIKWYSGFRWRGNAGKGSACLKLSGVAVRAGEHGGGEGLVPDGPYLGCGDEFSEHSVQVGRGTAVVSGDYVLDAGWFEVADDHGFCQAQESAMLSMASSRKPT